MVARECRDRDQQNEDEDDGMDGLLAAWMNLVCVVCGTGDHEDRLLICEG